VRIKYHAADGKDLRHFLINYDVFNRQTNSATITFDDWFEQRFFSSYIVKYSNQHDMYIRQYDEFKDNGLEALLERNERRRNCRNAKRICMRTRGISDR